MGQDCANFFKTSRGDANLERVWISKVEVRKEKGVKFFGRQTNVNLSGRSLINIIDLTNFVFLANRLVKRDAIQFNFTLISA